tara:strand:- start:154 stop:648 length:495 start_codon:yes stop_codon:yes gene_type:complete
MMTHGEMIAYLQDTANAPESAGVDNEIFGEMVKHFTKLQEENDNLKEDIQQYKDTLDDHHHHYDLLKDKAQKLEMVNTELYQENKGLQQELKDVRKLELAHMDTIKKLKSDAKDMSRYWSCIMDFCHNPDNPDKDYVVQWCEQQSVSDEDKQELLIDFGFDEEE